MLAEHYKEKLNETSLLGRAIIAFDLCMTGSRSFVRRHAHRALLGSKGAQHEAVKPSFPLRLIVAIAAEYLLIIGFSVGLVRWTIQMWETSDDLQRQLLFLEDLELRSRSIVTAIASSFDDAPESCTVSEEQQDVKLPWVFVRIRKWLPYVRPAVEPVLIWITIGMWFGVLASMVLTVYGSRSSYRAYNEMYKLIWLHGHTVSRFALMRANTVRLLGTVVFYHLVGVILCLLASISCGLFIAFCIVDSPAQRPLRVLLAVTVINQITEIFFVRIVVVPFFQYYRCGPVLFAISVWYMSIGLLKGATRIGMIGCFVLLSFFNPHACMFPDGFESKDAAHVCFTCYVAQRVESDKSTSEKLDALMKQGSKRIIQRQLTRKLTRKWQPSNHAPAVSKVKVVPF